MFLFVIIFFFVCKAYSQNDNQQQFKLFPIKQSINQMQTLPSNFIYDEPDYVVLSKIDRPKDRQFYVQGFKFLNSSVIAESSGLYGESVMHLLDSQTFKVLKSVDLSNNYFGEGSDWIINNKGESEIHQMTYKERQVFVYDLDLNLKRTLQLPNEMLEGWGLCRSPDQKKFYATDGSDRIFIIDPSLWNIEKVIKVKDMFKKPINKLNDLIFIGDKLFVNIYLTSKIVQIDASTGFVLKKFDFQKLVDDFQSSDFYFQHMLNGGHCLNGIAYDNQTDRLLITGKKWPFVYEIKFKNVLNIQ